MSKHQHKLTVTASESGMIAVWIRDSITPHLMLGDERDGYVTITYTLPCACGEAAIGSDPAGEPVCSICATAESRQEMQRQVVDQDEARFIYESCVEFNRKAGEWLRRRGG